MSHNTDWVHGKTLAHKHFEQNLLVLEERNPQIRLDTSADRFNWDNEGQKYTNLVTQAMFVGYIIAQNAERTHDKGHFVVAKVNDRNGKPLFAEQPYVHKNYKAARNEMRRLARRYRGTKFVLYNSVTTQTPFEPVERIPPEGKKATGCIDDNGIPIYFGDEVSRAKKGAVGTVKQSLTNICVVCPDNFDIHDLNEGKHWTIVSDVVLKEQQPSGDVNDTEEAPA